MAEAKTIAISGASGLLGGTLTNLLRAEGHRVLPLVRDRSRARGEGIYWRPSEGVLDKSELKEVDALIHLAGENVADGRWTDEKKRRIMESRTKGTGLVARALAELKAEDGRDRALISASAIGYYGDRGDALLDEGSSPGHTFLAEVCKAWESAADPAREAGLRVAHMRIGVVLSREGGALAKMKLPFTFGVGGKLGDGEQFISWIAEDDVARAFLFVLGRKDLSGPFNLTAPEPCRNKEFTEILGEVLKRPTFMKVPSFAIKGLLGEQGAIVLESARVRPQALLSAGFTFRYPSLEGALRVLLDRPR